MPAKSREAHADVHPRNHHPGYVRVDVAQQRPVQHGQVVQVPLGFLVEATHRVRGLARILRRGRKSRSVVHGVQICSVLDRNVRVDGTDDFPEFTLDFVDGDRLKHKHTADVVNLRLVSLFRFSMDG